MTKRYKILTVVGARPQFIKVMPVSKYLRKYCWEVLVHTGQHYDYAMSGIFFKDLNIHEPDYNLGIGGGTHAEQLAKMVVAIEKLLYKERPDLVLVYGDTNSTLAAALAAVKLKIPVAHVEAGPRSFDLTIPEEVNRVLTDRVSSLLFCPTKISYENLKREGYKNNVVFTGDVMLDMLLEAKNLAEKRSKILDKLKIYPNKYFYATLHRPHNVDHEKPLSEIIRAFVRLNTQVVFPVHPRTKKNLKKFGLWKRLNKAHNVIIIKPVGYLDSIQLESNALKIVTDSGGVQREAYFLKKPCLTLMDYSPWPETVETGWNKLVKAEEMDLIRAIRNFRPKSKTKKLFGNGKAGKKIAERIIEYLEEGK